MRCRMMLTAVQWVHMLKEYHCRRATVKFTCSASPSGRNAAAWLILLSSPGRAQPVTVSENTTPK